MYNARIQPQTSTTAGFTLIEILVSLSLFAIVVTISVGSLMTLLNANTKVQNIQSAVQNVSFVLDDMARNIRTGSQYECQNSLTKIQDFMPYNSYTSGNYDCSNNQYFAYTESDYSLTGTSSVPATWTGSNRIAYRLYNGMIEQHLGIASNAWEPLTSTSSVDITSLNFTLNDSGNTSNNNYNSPTLTIVIMGTVSTPGQAKEGATFQIETTVTQMVVDL